MSNISIKVTNNFGQEINVYTTMSANPVTPPSSDPKDLYPVYTLLGTVGNGGVQTFPTGQISPRVVFTRASDDFPIKLFVPEHHLGGPSTVDVTVSTSDVDNTNDSFSFYKQVISQPYSPVSLQFHELTLNVGNLLQLGPQVTKLMQSNGFPKGDYFGFSMVSYWAANHLEAWNGTYYTYEPPAGSGGFIIPQTKTGTLVIANGKASFTADDGGASYENMTFNAGRLNSAGSSPSVGLQLNALLRDLTWEGKPSEIEMFWTGTRNGVQIIVQPYEQPSLPWWVAAYNLAFTSFLAVQVVMAVDMAVHILGGIEKAATWLKGNGAKLLNKLRSSTEETSLDADPDAVAGDDVDPINVDTDVDTDVDIDTDVVTDTDNVHDTDTDVDIDVDIDVDDDVFAVIDIDVDVDVDIDTDVVTDTDNVHDTDTDVDVDVDIDTDVNVQPGGIKSTLTSIGRWVMTKGFPALVKNGAIVGAMMGAQKLLEVWRKQDEQDLANMSPQQSTGLGLLLNYMLNEKNSAEERWTTFADYVQQSQPSVANQQTLMSTLLMFKNDAADEAQKNWKWPESDIDSLVSQMAANSDSASMYKAYLDLAIYKYDNKPLPVKVAAGVVMKYLAKAN